jgi:DNA polymerase bacteriophage-type
LQPSSSPLSRWRCTAAKAAACSLPRKLEGAAKALGLPTQKDMAGHKLIKKYCKPRKPSKHNPKLWWDDPADLRAIYRYCKIDCQAEYELDQALPDLSAAEQKVWELDQRINNRGVLIDISTVKLILGMIREEMKNITRRVAKLSGGTIDSATQVGRVLKWVNEHGADMKNLQAPTIRDKLLEDDVLPKVRRMLEYRQASSRTSTGKYLAMLRAVGEDNKARELLLFHGACPTGRWAGKKLQPQNFPRATIEHFNSDEAIELINSGGLEAIRAKYGKSKVMDVLVSCTRGMLIASPGKEFFCGDFAAVEARLAFWVAEHEEGIRAFREGRKLYEEMASEAFGIPVDEIDKGSIERFLGKETILGGQYGCGWKAFMNNCHKKGKREVTPELAKKIIYTYRDVHAPIPRLWRNLEDAAIRAIAKPGSVHRLNKVAIYVRRDFLHIKLPSGRKLRYYKPSLSQKQLASGRMVPEIRYWAMENHQWVRTSIWGGTLTNHIVQGIARDLMVRAMFAMERAGYRIVLTIHDEILSERKKGLGRLKGYLKLMTELPEWAAGCPIAAEGWINSRYRK